ncbi:hypothetical protein, partial [Lysinibacillus sp. NPDC086135]|uniref:hypothetical protein n=1 Tax=Lysinibacillus sp. NPDC086135 TaxID=3364130 RepID=UPI00381E1950
AERQQQGFSLCESGATATRLFSVRKRSDSNKAFFCAKAERQQQCLSELLVATILALRFRAKNFCKPEPKPIPEAIL